MFPGMTAAAKAQGTFRRCSQQADDATFENSKVEELVLIIDYSRSTLTAALAVADCTYEYRRVLSSPELGADASPEALDRPPTKDFEQQIRQVMASTATKKTMCLLIHCVG